MSPTYVSAPKGTCRQDGPTKGTLGAAPPASKSATAHSDFFATWAKVPPWLGMAAGGRSTGARLEVAPWGERVLVPVIGGRIPGKQLV